MNMIVKDAVDYVIKVSSLEMDPYDKELLELDVNLYGNLFIFQLALILSCICDAPEEMKYELLGLAESCNPSEQQRVLSKNDFEVLYHETAHAAYSWQEKVPASDSDSDNELLALLRAFWRFARAKYTVDSGV